MSRAAHARGADRGGAEHAEPDHARPSDRPDHLSRLSFRGIPKLLLEAGKEFGKDDALTHSAALALYTAISLAPLVVLIVVVSDTLGLDAKKAFIAQVTATVGPLGGEAVESIAASATKDFESHSTPLVVAVAVALFSAVALFGQLQQTLNHIWNVEPVPGWNPWAWLRKRLLSFGTLAGAGFLMLVSLAISTGLSMLFTEEAWIWQAAEVAVSVVVFTALFAMLFRVLPDVKLAWRETVIGAAVTAVLFAAGKHAIGAYLGMSSITRAYGAMGSLLALIAWVYWSAAIVLFGAEITQVYAQKRRSIRPSGPAVKGGKTARGPRPSSA